MSFNEGLTSKYFKTNFKENSWLLYTSKILKTNIRFNEVVSYENE